MRKHISCSVIMGIAGVVVPLSAQLVNVSPIESIGQTSIYLPAEYAYDGFPSLVTSLFSSEEGSATVSVYDSNLENVAEISVSAIPVRRGHWKGYADEFEFNINNESIGTKQPYYDVPLSELENYYIPTWLGHSVKYRMEEIGDYTYAIPVASDLDPDNKDLFYDFFEYSIYGIKYPSRAVRLKNYGEVTGSVDFVYWSECYKPVHWEEPSENIEFENSSYELPYVVLYLEDFNSGSKNIGNVLLTQTLFNSDASYEYIAPILERIQTYIRKEYIYTSAEYEVFQKGFRIMSDNGNELQTILYPEGYYGPVETLVEIGDKTYLRAYVQPYNKESSKNHAMYLFYALHNKGSQAGVNEMPVAVRTSVEPTLVREGDPVRIDVRDTNAASGLTVTDMGGRVVYSATLPAEGSYMIPGSVMRQGINIVTVAPEDGHPVSTKVMVK